MDKRLACLLRKVSIYLIAVQTSDKADRIPVDRYTDTIVTQPNAEVIAFGSKFFEAILGTM